MEGFHYVDIFATKSIEYLLVIGYLLILALFWRILSRPAQAKRTQMQEQASVTTSCGWFSLVEGLHFHQGHSWAALGEGKIVTVGIDDFAQKLLGVPQTIELPPVGSRLKQGEKGWQLCIDSRSVEILSPVNGTVVEINHDVLNSPELISRDPYKDGWLMKVRCSRKNVDQKNLLSGKLAMAWTEDTVDRLRRIMAGDLGMVLQDGGLPVSGFARTLAPDHWDELAGEFLLSNHK